jgi:hypothetical protein
MPNDRITIAMDGDIPLADFAEALTNLNALIGGLTGEVGQEHSVVEWVIDELNYGSAVATTRGSAAEVEDVERIVGASEVVFRAVESGNAIPFDRKNVAEPAYRLTRLVGGKVLAIHFLTNEEFEATIEAPRLAANVVPLYREAYGRIEGTVENLYRRTARFMLIDSTYNRQVSCHLAPGQEEEMRGIWGHRAAVTGWITRDARTGVPVAVKRVASVSHVPTSERGQFRQARGAYHAPAIHRSVEEVIEELRDGS